MLIVHEKENCYPFPDVTIIVIVFVQYRHIGPGFVYNNIYFDITMYKACNSTYQSLGTSLYLGSTLAKTAKPL